MFGLGRAHPIQYTSGPEGLVMALKAVHSLMAFKEREAECSLICQEQTNCKHKTVICSNPAMFSALPVSQPNKTYFFCSSNILPVGGIYHFFLSAKNGFDALYLIGLNCGLILSCCSVIRSGF